MQHPNSYNDNIEYIEAEVQDDYSDDSLFNISSWGPTYLFESSQICMRTMNLLNQNSSGSMFGTK